MSCGNVPDGQGTAEEEVVLMPRRRIIRPVEKGICQRCRIEKSMIIIRSAANCRACFEANAQFRFTRQLYPPLQAKDKDKDKEKKSNNRNLLRPPRQAGDVLIALSGGAGSMAMLEMLCRGGYIGNGEEFVADKTKGEKEVVWKRGFVVYIEFCSVVGGEDRMEMMRGLVGERGMDFVGLRAEDVYDPGLRRRLSGLGGDEEKGQRLAVDLKHPGFPILSDSSSSTTTPLDSLRSMLSSLPSPSRPALLSSILSALLTITARSLPNISHLLLGETSTRQAQRVISGTALGRGWALPLELAPFTNLPALEDETQIVRIQPMKDLSLKEVAIFCRWRGLDMRNWRGWGRGSEGKGKGGASSLEILTEQFIAGLSVTHPSTVSTITRTGDKLVFSGSPSSTELCPLCQMPVDPSALEWKSRTALTSLGKTSSSDDSGKRSREVGLAPLLCYACLTTFTPSLVGRDRGGDPVILPRWMAEGVLRRGKMVTNGEMRSEIGSYLIGEEDGVS